MKLRHLAAALTLALGTAHAAPQSWLHQNLPPQTAAYLRLPNAWFLETTNSPQAPSTRATPTANKPPPCAAPSSSACSPCCPEEARAPLQNLQQHLDAPLEIALLQDKNELNLLIAATAQFADNQALQQTLAQTFPAPWQVAPTASNSAASPPSPTATTPPTSACSSAPASSKTRRTASNTSAKTAATRPSPHYKPNSTPKPTASTSGSTRKTRSSS